MGFLKLIRFIGKPISRPSDRPRNFTTTICKPNLYKPVHKNGASNTQANGESEIICSLVSKIGNSRNIDSVLNCANFDVSPKLVHEVLKKLNNAGVTALLFFRWAEKQKGFRHTSECYNALIESLGKIRQFKMVWLLVDEMKAKGILGKDTFALVSRRLIRARKAEEAIAAFESMETNHGLKPELQDYNRLLDALSKSKHVDIAHQVFDVWKNTRFTPDVKSYSALIEGWGQECNFHRLNKAYCEMINRGLQPDAITYGILINAFCKARRIDNAVELYKEMEATCTKATPHVYCTLIYALGSERRLDEAIKYFNICRSSGCGIEAPTYNALVGAYCMSGRVADAYRLVGEMRACKVGPEARTYEIILHHLARVGRLEEAWCVFEGMECDPGSRTYEILVRMFCNGGQKDMAMKVWDQMKGRGVVARAEMYAVLIDCLCHGGELELACGYVKEMMEMGMRPPVRVFRNLKRFLVAAGKEDFVVVLAHKIEKMRNTPLVG